MWQPCTFASTHARLALCGSVVAPRDKQIIAPLVMDQITYLVNSLFVDGTALLSGRENCGT